MKRGLLSALAVLAIAVILMTVIGAFDLTGAGQLLVLAGAGLVLAASIDGLVRGSKAAEADAALDSSPETTSTVEEAGKVGSDAVIDLREPASIDLVDELIADGQLTTKVGPLSDSDVETMLMVALSA